MDFHVVPRCGVSTPHPGEGCVQDVSKGGGPSDLGANVHEVRMVFQDQFIFRHGWPKACMEQNMSI